jgi:predicted Zn-dependent protease
MYRTSWIAQTRTFDYARIAAGALAAFALGAAIGCGGEKTTRTDSVSTTPVVGPTKTGTVTQIDSSGSVDQSSYVTVSFKDAEKAYSEKRYADAEQLFTGYVTERPDNPWGQYMLGLSSWKAGNLEGAKTAFVHSIELDPKHVKSHINLSRVLLEQKQPKDALKYVTAARKLDSTSAEVYRLLGRVRTEMNQPEEALAAYRVALSIDPKDVWSMNNMGLILVQQDRNEEALGPLARAVQLDSMVAVFQNNLGIALERTGHNVLAAESYRKALFADPKYVKASLSLPRVDQRSDDPSVMPIDLVAVAEGFDREIRGVVAKVQVQKPDSVRPPER